MNLKIKKEAALRAANRFYALNVLRLLKIGISFSGWKERHGFKFLMTILGVFFFANVLFEGELQKRYGKFFLVAENFAALKSFLAGIGSALVGV